MSIEENKSARKSKSPSPDSVDSKLPKHSKRHKLNEHLHEHQRPGPRPAPEPEPGVKDKNLKNVDVKPFVNVKAKEGDARPINHNHNQGQGQRQPTRSISLDGEGQRHHHGHFGHADPFYGGRNSSSPKDGDRQLERKNSLTSLTSAKFSTRGAMAIKSEKVKDKSSVPTPSSSKRIKEEPMSPPHSTTLNFPKSLNQSTNVKRECELFFPSSSHFDKATSNSTIFTDTIHQETHSKHQYQRAITTNNKTEKYEKLQSSRTGTESTVNLSKPPSALASTSTSKATLAAKMVKTEVQFQSRSGSGTAAGPEPSCASVKRSQSMEYSSSSNSSSKLVRRSSGSGDGKGTGTGNSSPCSTRSFSTPVSLSQAPKPKGILQTDPQPLPDYLKLRYERRLGENHSEKVVKRRRKEKVKRQESVGYDSQPPRRHHRHSWQEKRAKEYEIYKAGGNPAEADLTDDDGILKL